MPFNDAQKQTAIAPCFAAARKPLADYINKITLDRLYLLHGAIGAATLTSLARAFYPDTLNSLKNDLTNAELMQLGGMGQGTLQSLGSMTPQWIKSMLRVITGPVPVAFVVGPPGGLPAVPGLILNANGALDQTSTQPALVNTVVTELNPAGAAVRNVIFNAVGNCVGEINFANHGGTAVSGHAHVYPIMCVPLTGHHAMGTPHIDMADYPAAWRTLPVGVAPATPLGT